jgi:peptide/nickel transport system ATP-binding protein
VDHFKDICRSHNIKWSDLLFAQSIHQVGLTDIAHIGDKYVHQLSGGQLQRLSIACSLILLPQVLILDEPTTSLDLSSEAEIIALINHLCDQYGIALMMITHDIDVAIKTCHHAYKMDSGRLQFLGQTDLLPMTTYNHHHAKVISPRSTILKCQDVQFGYSVEKSRPWSEDKFMPLLSAVTLEVDKGEIIGVMGTSGVGKSTMVKLLAGELTPKSGSINWTLDRGPKLSTARPVQFLYQDARGSFDPLQSMRQALHEIVDNKSSVEQAWLMVNLDLHLLDQRPSQLSGGQLQRALFATMILVDPPFLILDEIFSALDMENKNILLCLLQNLVAKLGWTVMIVSHDEPLLHSICNKIYTLCRGQLTPLTLQIRTMI